MIQHAAIFAVLLEAGGVGVVSDLIVLARRHLQPTETNEFPQFVSVECKVPSRCRHASRDDEIKALDHRGLAGGIRAEPRDVPSDHADPPGRDPDAFQGQRAQRTTTMMLVVLTARPGSHARYSRPYFCSEATRMSPRLATAIASSAARAPRSVVW